MSRPVGSTGTPKYRHHKASGQAIVTICGQDHYLGPWKSKASHIEYDRLIGEWLSAGRQSAAASDLTVDELVDRYWTYAEPYYTDANHTGQLDGLRAALKIVRRLYGNTPANKFGPIALRTVRDAMIKADWCRTHVNAQIGRVRRMVKWCVSHELLPNDALHGLQAVEGLRYGKSKARETEPVKPVPAPSVNAILPYLSAQLTAMVKLQSITGMRSGELCSLRGCDLDMSSEASWVYRPSQHKNKHRGHVRIVHLYAGHQNIIRPFLKPDDPSAYLFSPAEAEAARRAKLHAARKQSGTPLSYGNRPGTNRKRKPKKEPGDKYTTASYRRAVAVACHKAFPVPAELLEGLSVEDAAAKATQWRRQHQWHPHQLRHFHATNVRNLGHGLEGVKAALGQESVAAAQRYAEPSQELAQEIAAAIGAA